MSEWRINGWLRSFTGGTWHVVIRDSHAKRQPAFVTLCAIPVPDYEYDSVRPDFPPGANGCIDCHERLGCASGHAFGRCTELCRCPCPQSMAIHEACPRCEYAGPLRVAYQHDTAVSICPSCADRQPIEEDPIG